MSLHDTNFTPLAGPYRKRRRSMLRRLLDWLMQPHL